ncbi:SDR family NAD(P)-dependent oxidoreductase [Aureimonas sp. AU4]|uniref:SDR family NAD(P)-dependent oxidoreductase n=1 Tax=Aureimonas sp. AU4 TaxID=1638163 RepID=UPI0007826B61|nr:SDR family NAD(P)-dependent oxidoreductase [Aureimonas sp. AU4]
MRRVAMISGASRGIGAAIAGRLAANDWAVSLGMRDPAATPLPDCERVLACRFDALDPESERVWVEATLARFGRLDGLVHNAGIAPRRSVLEASDAEFDEVFGINVKSPMRLTRHAWPHLVATRGRVVTMASLSGKRVKSAGGGLYALSKFAAMGLAHALRQCGAESGVRSTAICPSFVATDMAAAITATPAAELTQPDDIARIVHLVLELPSSASIAEIPVHWTVEDCF